ncbi:MAG: hypothetical protein DHS20C15_19680 [Planctomycetota bacterium]|nr:MAG: hypothetical protein DHS20C15_19680 [Planctomycetota bacterium]
MRPGLRTLAILALGVLLGGFHSPHDVLSAWVLSPDFAEDRTLFVSASRFKLVLRSTDGGLSFEPVNVGLSTGNVNELAISLHFADDRTLWALEGERLLRSTDAGDRWVKVHTPEALESPRALSLTASGQLLVGTVFSGIWRFDPRTEHWSQLDITGAGVPPIAELTSNASRTRFLALSNNGRVFLGDEEGADFRQARLPVTSLVTAAGWVEGEHDALYVGSQGEGVFRSFDGGASWERFSDGLSDPFVTDLSITQDEHGDSVLFVSTQNAGVFRATPEAAWELHARGLRRQTPQTDVHYSGVIAAPDFAESGLVYLFGFEGLHVSQRGKAWIPLHALPGSLVRNLALSPHFADDCAFWLSTYGEGLLGTQDAGESFVRLDEGRFTFPDAVDVSSDGSLAFGRPSSLAFTNDGGQTWEERRPNDFGFPRVVAFAPDAASSGVMLASVSLSGPGESAGVFRSNDHGVTWQRVGPEKAYRIVFAPSWESSGRAWLASPTGLYLSRDRGRTWTLNASCPESHVRDVAVRQVGDHEHLLITGVALERAAVHVSTDSGGTWQSDVAGLEDTLPVYVGFGGDTHAFVATHDQGVFRRTAGSTTWQAAGTGPRASFAFEVSAEFDRDRTVLAGGYEGAWISQDAGASWRLSRIDLAD